MHIKFVVVSEPKKTDNLWNKNKN